MKFSRKITYLVILVFLLSWPTMATTHGERPVINGGACTATTQTLSRGGEGWVIRFTQTGNTVLRERNLGFPPFHLNDGGYAPVLTDSAHHRPVFTCTPNELYFLVFQTERMFGGNESWREIRTQLYRKGIWDGSSQAELVYQTPLSTERIGDENFAIPLTNSGIRIGRAYALTGLVAQESRVVLFGQFEVLSTTEQARTSYAALDLSVSRPATLFFESGPVDIAQSESVCVTLDELFFVRSIGRLYTVYQVNSEGYVTPKLFNWSPIRVECQPGNATIILSSRKPFGGERRIGLPSTGRGR